MHPDYEWSPTEITQTGTLYIDEWVMPDVIGTLSGGVDAIDQRCDTWTERTDQMYKYIQEYVQKAVEQHFYTYYKPEESKEFQINEEEFEENLHTLLFE